MYSSINHQDIVQCYKKLNKVVKDEISRLRSQSYTLWQNPKSRKVNDALERLELVINFQEERYGSKKLLYPHKKYPYPYKFVKKGSEYSAYDNYLCPKQFKKGSLCSFSQMMDFKLKIWVDEYTYTKYHKDERFDEEVTIKAHWEELPSLRESLAISEYNPINSLGFECGTLWGASLALINVERNFNHQCTQLTIKR